MKGTVDVYGLQPAFFINAVDGTIDFSLGGLQEYQLVELNTLQTTTAVHQFTVTSDTPTIIVGLASASGTPTLSLLDPDGTMLDATSVEIIATTTATQTLLTVPDPILGDWQIIIDNLESGERHITAAWGTQPPASMNVPIVTSNDDGSYTIDIMASSSTPTSTISLFYDTSDTARTGKLIVQDLPLNTTSYRWQPQRIISDTYYIYAMVDDPLGTPAFAYSSTPITIQDTMPPDTPSNLQVSVDAPGSTSATISWNASTAPDTSGYRLYYQDPDSKTIFIADVPDREQTAYTQYGLYVDGDWEMSISAYDINANESLRSDSVVANINLRGWQVYLPIVNR
jgi:hypothetical protein